MKLEMESKRKQKRKPKRAQKVAQRVEQQVEVTKELKKLLARIENGDRLTLTEKGVVVGRLERVHIPPRDTKARDAAIDEAIAGMRKLRRRLKRRLSVDEIVASIAEGRK